jgi:UDPglucose 6-dehydrogenase
MRNCDEKRLKFTTDYAFGVAHSEVCFIAVPTPPREDGSCNLDYVMAAARSIAAHMDGYRVIVNKSTVPVGTGRKVNEVMEGVTDAPFDVVSNPEFLKEGAAINDCMEPDRIIVGVESERAREIMQEMYRPLDHNPIVFMDLESAEMTKYASNAMLAMRISFMNELSHLCEAVGANINQVSLGMGADMRIGPHFLKAGVGFGGSCFPKDVSALKQMGKEQGLEMPLLGAVEQINEKQKKVLHTKMRNHFGSLKGKTVAVWGLAFKPNTDDMREAPALTLIRSLLKDGAVLRLFDPVAQKNAQKELGDDARLTWCADEYEAAKGAHAIALVTEWKQFREVDFERVVKNLLDRAFFDGRNQYALSDMNNLGFTYHGIGIPQERTSRDRKDAPAMC